jgi:putative transposase
VPGAPARAAALLRTTPTIVAEDTVFFALHAHLVFVTKYRRKVSSANVLDDLRSVFANVCGDFAAELVAMEGDDDYVHLLVTYPPKIPLSRLVNRVASRASRLAACDKCIRACDGATGRWSPSYFAASCGGAPVSIIQEYVERQRTAGEHAFAAPTPLSPSQ